MIDTPSPAAHHNWRRSWTAGETAIAVDSAGLTVRTGKTHKRIAFADVTAARFIEVSGRTPSLSLVLQTPRDKAVLFRQGQLEGLGADPNTRDFVAACAAVLAALARARPDIELSMGPAIGMRAVIFAVSMVVAAVSGLVLLIAFDAGGELMPTALPMGLLGLAGAAAMMWSYNPFRSPRRQPPAETAQTLTVLAGMGT